MDKNNIKCEKCGGEVFTVDSGGSSCCAYVELTCTGCKNTIDWDFGTGEC